jgi:hypothetical protein
MKELFAAERTLTSPDGRPEMLFYSVLVDTPADGTTPEECYGVQIVRRGAGGKETKALPNLTTSTRVIDELMEQLITGLVTPATLQDVVEDWLAVR